MSAPGEDEARTAALAWLSVATSDGRDPLTREQLANDFSFGGRRLPLVDRGRGIRRPQGWQAALSIMTAVPKSGRLRPYDDAEGSDGLHRYKLRRDDGGRSENESLREAMRQQVPLMWFYGVAPGLFHALFPVFLLAEEPALDQFVVALTSDQRTIAPGSAVEETLRRYLVRQTRQRLHQPVFSQQVMRAYGTRCAVCSLRHRELLDAAHILGDTHPRGEPIVPNGLALCKIHHAAYDCHILGVRPDYSVEISHRLLEEIDGPMLRHGLQAHHRQELMVLPDRRADRPDRERLEERYAAFRNAS